MMIQRHDVSWMCDRVKGFDTFLKPGSTLQMIFDNGGFIAGGFLRMLLRAGTVDAMPAYFGQMGDIDVFCPDVHVYQAVKACGIIRSWRPSLGKNAEQGNFMFRQRDPIHAFVDEPLPEMMLQLVSVMYHEPVQMLETFDIANCKIAWDGPNIYIDDRVEELERSCILQLDMASSTLGVRIEKYFRKHGYRILHPESKGILMNWLMERSENQDWGRILRGERIVEQLMLLGSSVIPDDALIGFVGKFKSDIKSVNYAEMVHAKANRSHKEYIRLDVARAELNRRRIAGTIKPGDLVEVAAKELEWSCCMLLGRAKELGVWHVLFTTGVVATIHELGISSVVSTIEEVKA